MVALVSSTEEPALPFTCLNVEGEPCDPGMCRFCTQDVCCNEDHWIEQDAVFCSESELIPSHGLCHAEHCRNTDCYDDSDNVRDTLRSRALGA